MRVLVCGGRDYGRVPYGIKSGTPAWDDALRMVNRERDLLNATLCGLEPEPTLIIHGGAFGTDESTSKWAQKNGIPILEFKANWRPYPDSRKIDRSAGPRRNARMIAEGKPDLVVAFPGGKGTADMVAKARAAGIRIVEVSRPKNVPHKSQGLEPHPAGARGPWN